MADDYAKQTWLPGLAGGTPMSPSRWTHLEDGVYSASVTSNDAAAAVEAIRAAIGSGAGADGYTYGSTFPAPTLGGPAFFNLTDHKLYLPGGDAWYNAGTGSAATGAGAANAPTNLQAAVNPDNTVSLTWTLPAGTITAVTVREKFQSPGGVSGMPLAGTATSNTRPSSNVTSTREYYVTCTIGGVESAESNHVTVYLPYGSTPGAGGGTVDPGGGGGGTTAASFLGITGGSTGWRANLGIGLDTGHVDIPYSDLIAGYTRGGYFEKNTAGTGVVMTAYMSGKTTSEKTHYTRCETRELKANGVDKAAFSTSSSSTHSWEYEFALNHIQPNKPWCTIGQIHDASSDALAIKVKGSSRSSLDIVAVFYDTDQATKLLTGYDATAGTSAAHVTVKVESVNNVMKIYCNGVLKITAASTFANKSGLYWKLGVYPQSHSLYGGFEDPAEYCQATFYSHTVVHTPSIG